MAPSPGSGTALAVGPRPTPGRVSLGQQSGGQGTCRATFAGRRAGAGAKSAGARGSEGCRGEQKVVLVVLVVFLFSWFKNSFILADVVLLVL